VAKPEVPPGSALPGVVVAGHLCLDIFPDLASVPERQFPRLFQPGRMVEAGPASFAVGGAVSNTGLALARLGIPARLVAKLGVDPFADIVDGIFQRYARARIDEYGSHILQANFIVQPGTPTSYTVIISPPGVDRIFLHCTGANDTFVAGDVDFHALENAAIFHFGYPPLLRQFYRNGGRELVELFRRARKTGVTTSLDMTLPDSSGEAGQADWVAILTAVLPEVDIFLPSIEEILFMLRRRTYDVLQESSDSSSSPAGGSLVHRVTPELLHNLSSQLLDMGVKIAGFKLGERGFYLRTAGQKALEGLGRGRPADLAAWAGQTLWAPAFKVEVAGTTGAGDAAIAGLLSGLLRGLGPRQALSAAVAVGACNVEAADAQSGLRSWDDTLARIAAGWNRHALDLPSSDWRWDEVSGVWLAPI
jgi:sugar/nucleoside kinase (ribokinase family)